MTPTTFPEPSHELSDPGELFTTYFDFFRDTVATKLDGLSDDQLRTPVLPSGWTLLEMVKHLAFMEQRWIVWGFLGEAVDAPWGDRDPVAHRWAVSADESVTDLVGWMRTVGERTTEVLRAHRLDEVAADTGRFSPAEEDTPTLSWICFHVLQEYARHVGHVDVVRELIDGRTGE
jgi:uncharacterized damage-inducible protein DinB